MLMACTWSSHQQRRPGPLPRLWNGGRDTEVPTQWGRILLVAFKVKVAFEQPRDQFRASLTGTRLLAFLQSFYTSLRVQSYTNLALWYSSQVSFQLAFLFTAFLKAQVKQLQFGILPPQLPWARPKKRAGMSFFVKTSELRKPVLLWAENHSGPGLSWSLKACAVPWLGAESSWAAT